MRYPKLKICPETRESLDVFRGLNRNPRIAEGEFGHMQNLSADHYPVLAPRDVRYFYRKPASPQGLIAKDTLCYVDGACFVMGEEVFDMGLSVDPADCPKQLVSMGAYVIILPDKMYINTKNPRERGAIEAEFTSSGTVTVTPCGEAGEETDTPAYLRIEAAGIGRDFGVYDGVQLSGCEAFSGSAVIHARGDDFIVIAAAGAAATQQTPVTVARRMPKLDFVTESGNRLWGCRYGTDEKGDFVNRIYASRLGDFKNWECFMGLSTDSFAASCGSDGPFTGAVSCFGAPLFFKEKGFHKVYGSYPATFGVQYTACPGVQRGCEKSLAIVGDTLFYVSRGGVCAFDGSLPVIVSHDLGAFRCTAAAGGAYGSKYYLSARENRGWNLYVYDSRCGLWHREDGLHAHAFCTLFGQLYCIDGENCNILCLTGGEIPAEEAVHWMAESGRLGFFSPDGKYVSALLLRLQLEQGAKLVISVSYDGEEAFEELATVFSTSLKSFEIPVRPRRCDHFRLKLEGTGSGRVYSITKVLRRG